MVLESLTSAAARQQDVVWFQQDAMLALRGLTDEMCAAIYEALTIPNPKYTAMRRFSGWVPSSVPKMLHGYVVGDGCVWVPPGFGWHAWKIVQKFGGTPKMQPSVPFPPASIGLKYTGESRPYQLRVIREVGPVRQATVEMPCGAGKTDVAIILVCQRDVPTLVLVHTKDLMRQWVARFEARTGHAPATFGGGSKKRVDGTEPVIIATVQALRANPELTKKLAETRECVVVDEVHHTPATTFTEVLAHLRPRCRYGFTATKERADGLTAMIDWWIGPTRSRVERAELEEVGAVLRADLVLYRAGDVSFTYKVDETGEYDRAMKALLESGHRLKTVVDSIACGVSGGLSRQHLVISGSIEYGQRIIEGLCESGWRLGEDVVPLNGKMPKKERELALNLARAGARVIVASTVADEGLDLPTLTDVWLVTPVKSASKVEQRVGRILRPMAGKPKPRIHDFVDAGIVGVGRNERTGGEYRSRTMLKQFRNRVTNVYKYVVDRGLDEAWELIRAWRNR